MLCFRPGRIDNYPSASATVGVQTICLWMFEQNHAVFEWQDKNVENVVLQSHRFVFFQS
jgi:hypothetical protein